MLDRYLGSLPDIRIADSYRKIGGNIAVLERIFQSPYRHTVHSRIERKQRYIPALP